MDRRQVLGSSLALALGSFMPRQAAALSAEQGWRPLFDGRSLKGWTFYQEGVGHKDVHNAVTIENGVLHFLGPQYSDKDAPPGHISTDADWSDYHLRLDYKFGSKRWPPRMIQRRNSGLLYHMGPQKDRLFPACVEFQVEEGDVGDAIMVDTLGLQGPSLGGTPLWPNWIPAFPSTYEPPVQAGGVARQWHRHFGDYEKMDDWNTLDLYAFDDQAAHLVNGRIVNTIFKMLKTDTGGNKIPLTSGRIALELEWAEIMFRDIMIRPIDAQSKALLRKQGSE